MLNIMYTTLEYELIEVLLFMYTVMLLHHVELIKHSYQETDKTILNSIATAVHCLIY